MRSDQETAANYSEIRAGWDVYGSDGEKIGTVAAGDSEPGAQYFVVEKGFLFPTELYVPFSAISRIDDDDMYLSVTKDEIEGQGWDTMPTASADTDMDDAVSGYRERSDEGAVLERREERLNVDRQPVEAGEVRVGKHVVEEEQSVDVPVMREDVQIERRAVDRPASGEPLEEGEVRVPVTEERVSASKEARVVEELDVNKVARQDTERVTDTVRKEEFDVDEDAERR